MGQQVWHLSQAVTSALTHAPNVATVQVCLNITLICLLFYVAMNSQGDIARASFLAEEPVHTSWSRFCTGNHQT